MNPGAEILNSLHLMIGDGLLAILGAGILCAGCAAMAAIRRRP